MRKCLFILGALGLAAAPLFAAEPTTQPVQFQTINIQPGQGSSFTLQVPKAAVTRNPYALTGQTTPEKAYRLVPMRFGQGDTVWVRLPE